MQTSSFHFKTNLVIYAQGQPYALRSLCLRIQCTIVSPLLRITFKCTFYQNSNKSMILHQQTISHLTFSWCKLIRQIELFEDLKTILIYDIQLVSTKASLRDIPMCFACGRRAKLWIEIFFFLQIQKVIAYTNEKLIFQAFHYHSQGNGKK